MMLSHSPFLLPPLRSSLTVNSPPSSRLQRMVGEGSPLALNEIEKKYDIVTTSYNLKHTGRRFLLLPACQGGVLALGDGEVRAGLVGVDVGRYCKRKYN